MLVVGLNMMILDNLGNMKVKKKLTTPQVSTTTTTVAPQVVEKVVEVEVEKVVEVEVEKVVEKKVKMSPLEAMKEYWNKERARGNNLNISENK